MPTENITTNHVEPAGAPETSTTSLDTSDQITDDDIPF